MTDYSMARTLLIGGLWVFALARFTRLLVADEITDFIRIFVFNRWGHESKVGYFVQCAWCVSMWAGFGTAWIVYAQVPSAPWYLYPLIALTGSYWVGLLASHVEPDDDFEIEDSEDRQDD